MKPIIAIIIAAVGSTVAVEINKILLAAGLATGQALLVSSATAAAQTQPIKGDVAPPGDAHRIGVEA